VILKNCFRFQAFVYVSTAFCNCTLRDTVAEKIYPNQWEPSELINMIETLPSKEINENAQKSVFRLFIIPSNGVSDILMESFSVLLVDIRILTLSPS
jgi:hypothetical protein